MILTVGVLFFVFVYIYVADVSSLMKQRELAALLRAFCNVHWISGLVLPLVLGILEVIQKICQANFPKSIYPR